MAVDIFVLERYGHRGVHIPWLPEQITYESGGTSRVIFDIMDRGPVEVPTGSGLATYSWESTFPGEKRNDKSLMRNAWQSPTVYHNIFEDWRKKGTPLSILVIGYPFNTDVILDDYVGSAEGAFGDIAYKVSFIEDRDITIQTSTEETPKKRQETQSKTTSYTIKKGDTLWAISKKFLGEGSKWGTIYNANKEIIESTAKKYGKSSSNNGHWIYPGVVLQIPQ